MSNNNHTWANGDWAFYINPTTRLIACGKVNLDIPRGDIMAEVNSKIMLQTDLYPTHEAIAEVVHANSTNKNPVVIHKPDGLHTWGIEFNTGSENLNADASEFVMHACRNLLVAGSGWFWQSGSDSKSTGYQFFEYMGPDAYETVVMAAKKIADAMGTKLVDNT